MGQTAKDGPVDAVHIRLVGGRVVRLVPVAFEVERDGKVVARRTQVPLVLAWAFTVHKAQGMTLDYVDVDLTRAFDDGQAYVALSRARDWTRMRVVGLSPATIRASPKAIAFYKSASGGAPA
jgi:ATP-dependent DNA helicase PIF1